MSKIAFLGDVHFDGKSSSVQFIEFQRKFFENQFIPYLLENGIKRVIQFGDIFDRRTSINMRVLYHAKKMFFDVLHRHGIILDILIGNHDIFYLEKLEINSPEILLGDYDNIWVHTKPLTIHEDYVPIDIIPWICKENAQEVNQFMNDSHSDYCIGHFEIAGFAMYKGHVAEEGLSPKLFKKYKHVWSGHYHTRSSSGNISYIGTPMEITWQDCNDPRGFEVFDTETLKTEFIQNKYTLFHKIFYNDQVDISDFDYSQLQEKYIKVIVESKDNLPQYNNFIQRIFESGCHDVSIVENFQEYSEGTIEDTVKLNDTLSVINSYVDSIDVKVNKDPLKKLLQRVYIEAISETN